jgi:hypothetical protein
MPVGSGQTLRSTYPENVTGCRRVICYLLSAIGYRLSAIITGGDTDRHRPRLAPRRAKLIGLTLL